MSGHDRVGIENRDEFNFTALHRAASVGNLDEVNRLIAAGHPVDAKGGMMSQYTPLVMAVRGCRAKCLEALVRKGADVHWQDGNRATALHVAVNAYGERYNPSPGAFIQSFNAIVDILVRAGINVNAPNASGFTALHLTCSIPDPYRLKKLIEIGADPSGLGFFNPLTRLKGRDDISSPHVRDSIALLEAYHEERQRWRRMKPALVVMDAIKRGESIAVIEVPADASSSKKAKAKNAAAFLDKARWLESNHRAVQKLVLEFIG